MGYIKDETTKAMYINNFTLNSYITRLSLLATSIFKWVGLDKIAGRSAGEFLEKVLFEQGRAVFVKDPRVGFLVLRANPNGYFNNYEIPTEINAYSIGYNKNYSIGECVYIQNNDLEVPTFDLIASYCYRLAQIDRISDINLNAQKTPLVIEAEKKDLLTLKNIYMKYDGNIPVIYGNKNFDLNSRLNVLNTQAPYLLDKLDLHKQRVWNEVMTVLGINNTNTDKKERLIVDEVNSNNQLINQSLSIWLETRLKAKDEINKMFFKGKEVVSVEVNERTNNTLINLFNSNQDNNV